MFRPLEILNKWWNVKNRSDNNRVANLVINTEYTDVSVHILGSYIVRGTYNGQSYYETYVGNWSTAEILHHDPGTPIFIFITAKTTQISLFSQRLTEMTVAGDNIRMIDCNNNQLTELDMYYCRQLTYLKVGGNNFLSDQVQAIAFANSLPSFTSGQHDLVINGGSTYYNQIKAIAEEKGWTVYDS